MILIFESFDFLSPSIRISSDSIQPNSPVRPESLTIQTNASRTSQPNKMLGRNRFLVLIFLSAVVSFVIASPIFEVGENMVEDSVPDKDNDEQGGFERTSDGFENMNDFNFDDNQPINQPDGGNQSAEQNDDDGPPSRGGRERNVPSEMNKATAEEDSENGPDGDGSGEAGKHEPGARKQKYQDGEDGGGARSMDGDFEAFDKEGDVDGQRPPSSAEEGPRSGPPPGLPMPQMEQIDEPLIVNPGLPLQMPLHGARSARANSEEANNGGKYEANRPKSRARGPRPAKKKRGAPGQAAFKDYKFLPGGIKYLHETGASRTRIARHPLASYAAIVDHHSVAASVPAGHSQLLFYPLNRNPELLDAALF